MRFRIEDWTGNSLFDGKMFDHWDEAEEFLSMTLGDKYEDDRGEYYILEGKPRDKRYLHLNR